MSETQAGPTLSGRMFLFEKPELMSHEEHGSLYLGAPAKRYGFCANVRAIPITVSEIPAAMKDYPIVFASEESPIPLAVTGLISDVNLFVDENGNWEEFRYIPGYVRRYPFGIAAESGGERMAIVIDRAFDGMSESGGENSVALFDNGAPTETTQQAIEFCKTYEKDRIVTEDFGKRLRDLGLIKGQTAQYTPQGGTEPQNFAQYFGVEEEALKNLSDEQYTEMRKSGLLPVVYAVIMSMGNWRAILQRRAQRFGLTEGDILTQQPAPDTPIVN